MSEKSWTEKFEQWWARHEPDRWTHPRELAEAAYMAGASGERIERVRGNQQPMCAITSLSGALGEPLGCGFKQGHEGPHSWASLPTFLASSPRPQER